LSRVRIRPVSRARAIFFSLSHEEAGESMSALVRPCGFAHTSIWEAIEKAREVRDNA
jgi:hypothetical protein